MDAAIDDAKLWSEPALRLCAALDSDKCDAIEEARECERERALS